MTPKRPDASLELVPSSKAPVQPSGPIQAPNNGPGGMGEPEEADLGQYLDVVVRGKWLVLATLATTVILAGAYALLATPIFRSDALVQVETKKPGTGGLDDLSALLGESSPAETEIEILRSRSLIGEAVDELRLDIRAQPRRFPVLGGVVARRWKEAAPRPAPIGLGNYAWGGERIIVDRLEVPAELESERLLLEHVKDGAFSLRGPTGLTLLEGRVGQPASGSGVRLFVSELVARPGTQFRLVHEPREKVVEELQDKVRVAEKGKKTGIIELSLEGADSARTAAILDALAGAYLRQNVERKSAEAAKTLDFLQEQLPQVRASVESAEKALQSYRANKGSMDVSLDTQTTVGRAVEVEKAITELKLAYAELRQRFTESHPSMIGLRQKLERLQSELASNDQKLRRLPTAELESARLLRDVKVSNELYLTLLNKAQELKVVKEGTLGNVRILDPALVSADPVSPRKPRLLALALLLGLAGGVALAFVRNALLHGVDDPNVLEQLTGVAVYASVLHSDANAERTLAARKSGGSPPLIAAEDPKDLAVESLRGLRTSLQFALFDAPSNVVVLGGPAPAVGKSFVTANLAHLLGDAGKRVIVVDADLRRGHLHEFYSVPRGKGLSDAIAGDVAPRAALIDTPSPRVRLLASGTVPPNPAELLGSERFHAVLEELSREADVVLVDTPPILAVTDAALVGRHAGVNLLVLKASAHPPREIQAALRQLARGGVRVNGLVLNDVHAERGIGRYSYHYQYKYE